MKRLFDIMLSIIILLFFSPFIFLFAFLVFLEDFNNPFYISKRVGKHLVIFKMIKLRSMVVNQNNIDFGSTKLDDVRITKMGRIIRKFKLDEIVQVWNVLMGQMSFVGPRPNILKDVNIYTLEEKKLLDVQPGITDFASIVFSDESNILEGSQYPDIKYNQIIRPWKSRLGIIYVKNINFLLDIKLIIYTIIALINKNIAIELVLNELKKLNANERLLSICKRDKKLEPYPPPGTDKIFESY